MTEQKDSTGIPEIIYLRNIISEHDSLSVKARALSRLSSLERTLDKQSTAISTLEEQVEIASRAAMKVSGYLDLIVTAIEATTHGKNCSANYMNKTVINFISAINKTESAYKETLRVQKKYQETSKLFYHSPRVHQLKILPEFFVAVFNGYKKSELRLNDRDFSVGDYLLLNEWELNTACSEQTIMVEVTHITPCDFAIPGYVMLSFKGVNSINSSDDGFGGGIPF